MIAREAGGSVDQSESNGSKEGGYFASATLRVPPDAFDRVVDDLKELGELAGWHQTATDVTSQVIDLDARISGLRTSIERLEQMLVDSDTVNSLLEIERMLTTRQGELDSLLAERSYFADQVGMSTLNLDLRQAPDPVGSSERSERIGPWASLQRGWNSFLDFGSGLLEVLAYLLPWLVAIALIATAVVIPLRATAPKRRARRDARQDARRNAFPAPRPAPEPGLRPPAGPVPPPLAGPQPPPGPAPSPQPPAPTQPPPGAEGT
jgi:hypothetical protein